MPRLFSPACNSFFPYLTAPFPSSVQLFLETPRARVTLSLAHHHEALYHNATPKSPPPRDSLITASDLLSDLQVETYSSMERVEKTKFIMEQMRLLLEVARMKDAESPNAGKAEKGTLSGSEPEWVKLRVQSRKINEQFLKDPENEVYHILVVQGLCVLMPRTTVHQVTVL
jgi:26S proteasome regulatory subunit N5